MPNVAVACGLTETQVETFWTEGYLVLDTLFTPDDLQPLMDEIGEVIGEQAEQLRTAGELADTFPDEGFLTRLTRLTAQSDKVYWALAGGRHRGAAMFDLIRHPKLLAVARSLLGDEIVASSAYRIRPKVPGFGHGVVPWHQDSGYFEAACDNSLILTVWLPLVDATVENGCLQVVPRMHLDPVVPHHSIEGQSYLRIGSEHLPADRAVITPVPLGGALLLHNRTPHCSTDNRTDVVRWSVDIRYQGLDAPSPALPVELAEEARAAAAEKVEGIPVPAACYAPEADFLVHSRRRPEAVVDSWEAFHRIRTTHQPGAAPGRWPRLPADP